MALSEQEQRMLDEIESALYAEDPKFGSAMSARAMSGDRGGSPRGLDIRSTAILVLGLLVLVAGMFLSMHSLWFVALSVVGFAVMFGAGVWAMTGKGKSGMGVSRPRRNAAASRGRGNGGGSRGGGGRLEERFRNRFGNM